MKVKSILPALAAGVVVLTAATLSVSTAFAADKPQQPSAKVAKPLHEAQEDLKAKKWTDAIAKLKEADAVSGKTAYDQHVINDFYANAYINTQSYADAAKYIELEIDDGFTTEQEKPQKLRALAELNYQIKNYDKVIEFGNRSLKNNDEERMRTLVGQAYYLKGDFKGTQKFEDQTIDTEVKAGQTPKKDQLLLYYSACQKNKDDACATHAMERLVTYYPEADYWSQLLYGVRAQISNNDADTLQCYRLMSEVDVLKTAGDYNEMAQLALEAGSPGEASAVLQKGFQKGNVFTEKLAADRNQRLLDSAKKQSGSDQASLPKLQSEADASPQGMKNVGVGIAYLGYGQYDKAVDQLSKGLDKGGLKDEAQARLLLGIAQLKAGHKEDAVKSFKAVKGDPILERLASLWVLHSKQA
jgi:tetratricopeptide (TPR) repeat protein